MSRWDAFTEKECALICISIAGNFMAIIMTEQPKEEVADLMLDSIAIINEIGERMDIPALDAEVVALMQEFSRVKRSA